MMGFKPPKADADLWYKDMGTHYEYIGTYVDDLLIASKNPHKIIEKLKQQYVLKGVGIPEYYLGGDVIVGFWIAVYYPEQIGSQAR